ncbi:hypothetical protein [Thioalkalivibrio paradoxus]|uniref:Uncharacterized protein n=1 Tax=Thioalkalivibrio paradoxus ARh 1 TaxID=713585 RepID=W0DKK7_9GAMM|nr:hypothetical protein [Thioalkalivibrio paradoxus]AHE97420.1 hypothetical protein THITH_03035 [Thioalkalivibrio paradoxus ARh 1]
MTEAERESCLVSALLRDLNNQRLPKLFAIKERLDRGELADPEDIRYIHDGVHDALWVRRLCERHPDLASICTQVTKLYKEITEQALENETRVH